MGLIDIRKKAIECLKSGTVQAENRADIREKNLLKTGVVLVDEVIKILSVTKGSQYRKTPYKDDPSVDVHIFEPRYLGENWHIKLYFIEPDCWFISVHKSHVAASGSRSIRRK